MQNNFSINSLIALISFSLPLVAGEHHIQQAATGGTLTGMKLFSEAWISPTLSYNTTSEQPFYGIQIGTDLNELSIKGSRHSLFLGFNTGDIVDESSSNVTSTSTEPQVIFNPPFLILVDGITENITRQLTKEVDSSNLALNYLYERDLNVKDKFGFYIGGGAGVAFFDGEATLQTDIETISVTPGFPPISTTTNSAESSYASNDETVFFLQAFAGVNYNILENLTLYTGLRYQYLFDPDMSYDLVSNEQPLRVNADIDEHNLYFDLGVRMRF